MPPASLKPRHLPLLPLLLVPIVIILFFHPLTQTTPHVSHFIPPIPSPTPDLCLTISNPDPPHYRFNSRTLCLTSNLCLSDPASENGPSAHYYPSSRLSDTKCLLTTPNYKPLSIVDHTASFGSCAALQHKLVVCAQGTRLYRDDPQCPIVANKTYKANTPQKKLPGVTVVVPDWPYTDFIYHYGSMVTTLAHTIEQLGGLMEMWNGENVGKLNILFRMKEIREPYRAWKKGLLNAMMKRFGNDVDIYYGVNGTAGVCMEKAVVLGAMGHCNALLFANSTRVPLDGYGVPRDAVRFKRAVWNAFGVQGVLPGEGRTTLPPFVVGYAKREAKPSDDGYYWSGHIRRFAEDDEKWFEGMLKEETDKVGAELRTYMPSGEQNLEEQVKEVAALGFIVGIHGANLMNAVFMRPYGGFMEVLPGWVGARCYIGGSNSGLAYYRHIAEERASPEESGCSPADMDCKHADRQRMVKIKTEKDRKVIRTLVQNGLQHLVTLREKYPHGIPTKYNEKTGYFDIV